MSKRNPLTQQQYLVLQGQLMGLIELMRTMPLDQFIEKADELKRAGMLTDPETYQKARRSIQTAVEVAEAAKLFKDALAEITKRAKAARDILVATN